MDLQSSSTNYLHPVFIFRVISAAVADPSAKVSIS